MDDGPETAGLQPPATASSLNPKVSPYTPHAVAVHPLAFKVHKLALLPPPDGAIHSVATVPTRSQRTRRWT
jgi:hypothetical protein